MGSPAIQMRTVGDIFYKKIIYIGRRYFHKHLIQKQLSLLIIDHNVFIEDYCIEHSDDKLEVMVCHFYL